MHKLILTPVLRDNEIGAIIYTHMAVEENRDAMDRWLRDNFRAVLERIPSWRKGEIVAVYLGRGGQSDIGQQAVLAAKWYNSAWIAPELPMGMVVLDVLRESS